MQYIRQQHLIRSLTELKTHCSAKHFDVQYIRQQHLIRSLTELKTPSEPASSLSCSTISVMLCRLLATLVDHTICLCISAAAAATAAATTAAAAAAGMLSIKQPKCPIPCYLDCAATTVLLECADATKLMPPTSPARKLQR
eukprot:16394-Heterococcus_DN1.PRE.1